MSSAAPALVSMLRHAVAEDPLPMTVHLLMTIVELAIEMFAPEITNGDSGGGGPTMRESIAQVLLSDSSRVGPTTTTLRITSVRYVKVEFIIRKLVNTALGPRSPPGWFEATRISALQKRPSKQITLPSGNVTFVTLILRGAVVGVHTWSSLTKHMVLVGAVSTTALRAIVMTLPGPSWQLADIGQMVPLR
jgi:hypothetical protein